MMSGTDLSLYGVVRPFYRPRRYAERLAKSLGCSMDDTYTMVNCLRSTNLTWEAFVEAQRQIIPNVSRVFTLSITECRADQLLIETDQYKTCTSGLQGSWFEIWFHTRSFGISLLFNGHFRGGPGLASSRM